MLADSPHAYLDTLADASTWSDSTWQTKLASRLLPDSLFVVASDPDGRWVGTMGAREYVTPRPGLWVLEVYLNPDHRHAGTAAAMLSEVEGWARSRGHDTLYLDVHERATAARRFYAKHGFRETGATQPYGNDPTEVEFEMVKRLDAPLPLPGPEARLARDGSVRSR